MGFALDPANPLYEAGQSAATDTVVRPVGTASDVDLDLGGGGLPRISTDIMLDAGAVEAATAITDTAIRLPGTAARAPAEMKEQPAAVMPDFTLEVPSAGAVAEADIALEPAAGTRDSNVIDFHIDLPKAAEPVTVASDSAAASGADDAGLDFKIEGLDLQPQREPQTVPSGGGREKDGQWYDVQTKFDLAKAYQEMGDRDGAREILQEVVKEGDAEQKAQATKLLESLG
jgi:pilus assembly protein FimV